ncbi:EscU/YscU/HrcU family type III secretion system export apparatus switch protein [Azospirillum sp. SYSU D00513]|uniref:EscU/YscU/HrcU family type III secretion system export apparatus switch protein n=1 Tax=Azospirillum sp. SYSU D00513 TaxID=2812561 RepID=UPI001A9664B9|nr:EscU/YscU/HrcU family type III secretion system export apparatus switch protein [Azospirillum sp. SYSU D00513]
MRKPPGTAVALGYDGDNYLIPTVLAVGEGDLAIRLAEIAAEHGVPIRSDPALAAVLARLPMGTAIPRETWAAVARIIAYLHEVESTLTEEEMARATK